MRSSLRSTVLSAAAVASTASAAPERPLRPRDSSSACSDLATSIPTILSNITIYAAEDVTANQTFTALGNNLTATTDYCRFGANVTTSDVSMFTFELYMPHEWDGRFLMNGNGGDAGSVQVSDMNTLVGAYGIATASTDTGHNSTAADDGSFARDNYESAIDFAYRSVHLTTVYSKSIIAEYYNQSVSYSYFSSCSGGGRMAWKGVQMYPEDWDGVIAGDPAMWTPRLDGHQYWRNMFVNYYGAPGYVSATQFSLINQEVFRQCDADDGLVDYIITEPSRCHPDYSTFSCSNTTSPFFNSSTCLSDEQMQTFITLYSDWHFSDNGELAFPAYLPGTEAQMGQSAGGSPSGNTGGYFDYQVLNYTDYIEPAFSGSAPIQINGTNVTLAQLEAIVRLADEINPASNTAMDPDISGFLNRSGKVIHYHGAADGNIPTGSSLVYRDRMLSKMGDAATDGYRYYQVDGMHHCSGGVGPVNFGQSDGNSLYPMDSKYDVLGAVVAWVENGTAPDYLIGAMYETDDYLNTALGTSVGYAFAAGGGDSSSTQTVNFTRKICPYPLVARFTGGDWSTYESFVCN
ncbi:unnamed protein product [Peniophora sp. CBMAI 1063]|nr:unnamed protein product [Peniophora sp. CBMAI 1063]